MTSPAYRHFAYHTVNVHCTFVTVCFARSLIDRRGEITEAYLAAIEEDSSNYGATSTVPKVSHEPCLHSHELSCTCTLYVHTLYMETVCSTLARKIYRKKISCNNRKKKGKH